MKYLRFLLVIRLIKLSFENTKCTYTYLEIINYDTIIKNTILLVPNCY